MVSSIVEVYINDESKLANIPDHTTIIKRGFDERPRQATATNISGVRLDLDKRSDLDVGSIWVKFGCSIARGKPIRSTLSRNIFKLITFLLCAPLAFTLRSHEAPSVSSSPNTSTGRHATTQMLASSPPLCRP